MKVWNHYYLTDHLVNMGDHFELVVNGGVFGKSLFNVEFNTSTDRPKSVWVSILSNTLQVNKSDDKSGWLALLFPNPRNFYNSAYTLQENNINVLAKGYFIAGKERRGYQRNALLCHIKDNTLIYCPTTIPWGGEAEWLWFGEEKVEYINDPYDELKIEFRDGSLVDIFYMSDALSRGWI